MHQDRRSGSRTKPDRLREHESATKGKKGEGVGAGQELHAMRQRSLCRRSYQVNLIMIARRKRAMDANHSICRYLSRSAKPIVVWLTTEHGEQDPPV